MRGAKVENIFLLRHRISKESRFSLVSMGKTEMEVTTIDSTKKFKENMPRFWQKKMWLVIDGEIKEIFDDTTEHRRLMLLQTLNKSYIWIVVST